MRSTAVKEKEREASGELLAEFESGCLKTWRLEQAPRLLSWLDTWDTAGRGGQETNFWRRRVVMAMQQRLQKVADSENSSGGAELQIYSVHQTPEGQALAIAVTSERPLGLEPLRALHLDQIASSPEAAGKGFGAALLRGLVQRAQMAQQLLVLEPQSPELEAYFLRQRFRPAKELDPYLWIPLDLSPQLPRVQLRYVLQEEDHERLLAAFKRPPEWTGVTEEFFLASRQDTSALEVLALRVFREGVRRTGAAWRMTRASPAAAYQAQAAEEVELAEAMAVMRSPEKLEEVAWDCAQGFGRGKGRLPGNFAGLGRCSVYQKAYSLPGLAPSLGVEMVVEALELQMRPDPIYSISISCTVGILAEVLEAARHFLDSFHIRAALHRNPNAWDVEVVQSDGLALASMEMPPLPRDKVSKDPF